MSIFNKDVLYHHEFYIAKFTKHHSLPYILFIHGGPGANCGVIEYLIEEGELFSSLDCNIILYDQRNCGRSKSSAAVVSHQNNVSDLQKIISHLVFCGLTIHALIGHSYGAKLLYDYYKSFASLIPGVFVSTANSILTPRLNNLLLDLSYLKQKNVNKYNEIFNALNEVELNKIWEISEKLTLVFQENKNRPYLYWANLEYFDKVQNIQKIINLPINADVFFSVRKDLYKDESNFPIDINKLNIPKLWVNGFHDFIMNGHETALQKNSNIVTFYKSAHYPHIEENKRFSEILNEFFKSF